MLGVFLRLPTGRKANHDNGDPPRVEQPARHGAVELCRRQVALVFWYIMNPVDKRRALAAVAGRVHRNLGSTAAVSNGSYAWLFSMS